MDNRLHDRLDQVAGRFRQLRFLRILAVLGWVAAGLIACVWLFDPDIQLGGSERFLLIAGAALGALLLAILVSALSYRDRHQVARRIEHANPSLRARLLTAIELQPKHAQPVGELGGLTYLQKRVVDSTLAHAISGQWNETVPSSRLAWARCSALASFACLAGGMLAVGSSPNLSERSPSPPLATDGSGIEVLPGDVEIEKGNSLVVTARFAGDAIPSDVVLIRELQTTDPKGPENEERSGMNRNLDDPVFGGYFAAVEHDFTYRVETPSLRTRDYRVRVFEFPQLVRSDAILTPPAYTSIAPKTIENTLRVTAVEGTELTWQLHVNKPLVSVRLVSEDAEGSIDLRPTDESATTWHTTLTMTSSQRWTLELRDEAGRESKFPPQLIARVLPNRPAELKLVTATDATVSPIEELPVAAAVEDDFGIHRVGLSYAIGSEEPQEIELSGIAEEGIAEEGANAQNSNQVSHTLDFEQLGAKADQLLSYHFWAEDTGPDGNTRRTTSDIYFAEVRPFEQIFREGTPPPSGPPSAGQQQQAQQAGELAELQKQIVSATWNLIRRADVGGASGDPALRSPFLEDAKTILDSQQAAIQKLSQLTETLPPTASPELVEAVANLMQDTAAEIGTAIEEQTREPLDSALVAARGAYQALLRLRAREFDVVRSSPQSPQGGGGGGGSKFQQQLDQLELKNDPNRYETERTAQAQNGEGEPASEADQQAREILSRLEDLARRQTDLNKQLRDLQLALQQAANEEEREAARRQLQRLREQQQELLRDADELASQMNRTEASQAAAAEQLEQTRENLREAERALQQEQPADALAAGSRAERSLEQMRDEFKKESSEHFSEAMRQMRDEAAALAEQQAAIEEQMQQMDEPLQSAGLRSDENGRTELADRLLQQSEKTAEIVEKMRETVREAEQSEPLLANRLYEAHREAQQGEIGQRLRLASDLLRRGYDPQARQASEAAGEQIERLEAEIEDAARSILGDPSEALARAASELDTLEEQLTGERPEDEAPSSESPETGAEPSEPSKGQPGEGQPGEGQPGEGQPGEGQPGEGQPPGGSRADGTDAGGEGLLEGNWTESLAGGDVGSRPITGDGFRQWADGLREVEDMLDDPELRSRAAGIRDRAREMRRQVKRHAAEPQWSEIEEMIAEPLRQLRADVAAELLRRSADRHAVVPLDGDPVPETFADAVRKYYEQLGTGR